MNKTISQVGSTKVGRGGVGAAPESVEGANPVNMPVRTAAQDGEAEEPRRKLDVRDFLSEGTDITELMFQARQPFIGLLSKGVRKKYIDPLLRKHGGESVQGRIFDIAWMSSGRVFGLSGGKRADLLREIDEVPKDRISTFTLLMGGRHVKLCKVYNNVDFLKGPPTACLIMLPEEAENFDPNWHFPTEKVSD